MKIFLTGGTGMVGQAILRLSKQHPTLSIFAPTRQQLNLLDRADVRSYLAQENFDAVIHCAAKVGGIKANISDPIGFTVENTLISTHVIEESRRAGIQNLINLGSSCMYPRDYRNPLREEDVLAAPLEPTNEGYALAKITAAKLCQYISEQHVYAYRTFIPCNLYGVGDKFDLENGHMIAAAIVKIYNAVQNNHSDVEIWGDGSARREFLYVDDLAKFILQSIPNLKEMPPFLNMGLGRDYTVKEYFEIIAESAGFAGKFIHKLDAPVGMAHKLMDITKAQSFGWNPETPVGHGIDTVYKYYENVISCGSVQKTG